MDATDQVQLRQSPVDEIIYNSAIVIYGMFILYVYTFEVSVNFIKPHFCLWKQYWW